MSEFTAKPSRTVLVLLSLLPMACGIGPGGAATSAAAPTSGLTPGGLVASMNTVADQLTGTELAFCEKVFTRAIPAAASKVMIVWDPTRSRADLAMPAKLITDLQTASQNDGSLTIISVDGRGAAPKILAKDIALSTPGPRDRPSVARLAKMIPECVQRLYLNPARPKAAGTDLYRGFAAAAETVTSQTKIWALTDFLSNTGAFNLTKQVLASDPAQAAKLVATRAPLDLRGATFNIAGLGNSSTPLQPAARSWLNDFAVKLCKRWSASGCQQIKREPTNPDRAGIADLPKDTMPPFPQ